MKDKIITEIQVSMAHFLSPTQQEELRKVLMYSLRNAEIKEKETADPQKDIENGELLDVFIAAKRIEGCSEKSLKYYDATIQMMFAAVDKPIRETSTDDLRVYLGSAEKLAKH